MRKIICLVGVYLWTVWAVFFFFSFQSVLFFIMYVLVHSGRETWAQKMHTLIPWNARVLLFFFGIRVEEYGRENIDKTHQYIYTINHRSFVDHLVCLAYIPQYNKRFIAKIEALNLPFAGFVIKHLYVTVNRSDKASRQVSFQKMRDAVGAGCSMMIYPEGTRNTSKNLIGTMYDGAFRLAIETGVPIVPVVLVYASERLPKQNFPLTPGMLKLLWLPPIEVQNYTAQEVKQLKEKVQKQMIEALKKYYPSGYYT